MKVQLARWQCDALHAFWSSQGVKSEPQRAKLVRLASDKLLFRSPHDLSVRLQALRHALWLHAGIHDADVGAMVGRYPRVLCGDVATSAAAKLAGLVAGLPGVDLKLLLEASPQLLSLEPQATVVARAHALQLLMPHCDVLRMCELHPQLLTVSVPRTVEPALAVLVDVLATHGAGAAETAVRVAQAAPRLLTSAPGTVRTLQGKPASLGRLLSSSERALLRIAFVRSCAPEGGQLGPLRLVGLSAAAFGTRFPGFEAWLDSPEAAAC